MDGFGVRLRAAMAARAPVCVGLDPHATLLDQWGLPDSSNGLQQFVRTVIDALADRVAICKPQAAFFERFGSSGMAVLESAIGQLRDAGALVLLDVKRGDIGSTVAAYAAAYLDPAHPLSVDAVTANPYLGVAALAPMVETAQAHGKGMFVLARTSNPEASLLQDARTDDGRSVAQYVIDEISQLNAGAAGSGSFGVVIGATAGSGGLDLSRLGGPVLAPGLGAQGARAVDLPDLFGAALPSVVPVYSRMILQAGPDPERLRAALDSVQSALREAFERATITDG